MKQSGIYIITNTINAKFYIGSSCNIIKRWKDHRTQLNRNIHHNVKLQRHAKKYGSATLIFKIIELCDPSILLAREQHFLDILKPAFNHCPIAGSTKGLKHPKKYERINRPHARKGKPRGYPVTIHRGETNINSKPVKRIDPSSGEVKIYPSLSSVKHDGIYFQNVYNAMKKNRKHKGYYWAYLD